MLGISPWLDMREENLEEWERRLQDIYRKKAVKCIEMAVDPESPDYMNFTKGDQPLVDTAFLAHAIVRAPGIFAKGLSDKTHIQLTNALRATRSITPSNNNWLFFSAMIETGLCVMGEEFDMTRVMYALRTFGHWYKGDGIYGDGEGVRWDYYNSFVIQPMYVDIVKIFSERSLEIARMEEKIISRAARYASVLERMIGPDGSYPIIGRSICYRFGAFQLLAQMALQHNLEEHLNPAAVRCALTAVIRKTAGSGQMFDKEGWLQPGIVGVQPELAEGYINIGSLYLCMAVFLPLGLSKEDRFWNGEDEDWSGKKVWSGEHISIDHGIN